MAIDVAEVIKAATEKVADDVLAAVKADERYAPLVASIADQILTAVSS
jgi:hypothetical protein